MAAFMKKLRRWEPFIKRGTYVDSLLFQIESDGTIIITAKWPEGEHVKRISREEIYPRIAAGMAIRPHKKPCRVSDEIIMEILEARK